MDTAGKGLASSNQENLGESYMTVSGSEVTEVWASVSGSGGVKALARLYARLSRDGVLPVYERVYGSLDEREGLLEARRQCLREARLRETAASYIEGAAANGNALGGVHVYGLAGASREIDATSISLDGEQCGSLVVRGDGRMLFASLSPSPEERGRSFRNQAGSLFGRIRDLLASHEFGVADVVRTWFYLQDIDADYAVFNEVRRDFFRDRQIPPDGYPASTATSGAVRRDALINVEVLAAAGPGWRIRRLPRAVQGPPFAYGSCFSRASILESNGRELLLVSGTASIDRAGQSVGTGNARAQWQTMLGAFSGLIAQCGFRHAPLVHASLYVKEPRVYDELRHASLGDTICGTPCVAVVANICRPELLVEIEAMAIKSAR